MRDAGDWARQEQDLEAQLARSASEAARQRRRLALVADREVALGVVSRFVAEPSRFGADEVSPVVVARDLALASCWGGVPVEVLEDLTARVDGRLAGDAMGVWAAAALWGWPGLPRVSYERELVGLRSCWRRVLEVVPALGDSGSRGGFVDGLLIGPTTVDGRRWATLRTVTSYLGPHSSTHRPR